MNLDKYRNERRAPRTEIIPVPLLADYFDKDKKPEFTVRGLTGAEFGRCEESANRQEEKIKMAAALIGGDADAKAEALKQSADGPKIPDSVSKRIEMLAIACVEPKLEHSDAVLISEDFPIEFYQLTNAINRLTGAGRVLGKPKVSGKGKTSGTA